MGISMLTVLYALWAVIAHFALHETVQGWTTTVVLVALFASVQLLMTGILGEYIGRIYEQVKLRPLYVVGECVNLPVARDTDEIDAEDARGALPVPARAEVAIALGGAERPQLAPPTPGIAAAPGAGPASARFPPSSARFPVARPNTLAGVAEPANPPYDPKGDAAAAALPGVLVEATADVPSPPQTVTRPMKTLTMETGTSGEGEKKATDRDA
jgi:hypothetical protein